MSSLVRTWYLTGRQLRVLLGQPVLIAITVVQPLLWLLLFGTLFSRVVRIPGYGDESYISFLAPGIVVMSGLASAGWSGTQVIFDIEHRVMDRFLLSPGPATPILASLLARQGVVTAVQSAVIVILASDLDLGVRLGRVAYVSLVAVLLASAFASLANWIALVTRRQEILAAGIQFLVLPMSFLSSVFLDLRLAPGWVRAVATVNPLDWAAVAARGALRPGIDWSSVGWRTLLLAAFAFLCYLASRRGLGSYRRSL